MKLVFVLNENDPCAVTKTLELVDVFPVSAIHHIRSSVFPSLLMIDKSFRGSNGAVQFGGWSL